VYLVDAADRERFPESMRELNGLLSDDGLGTVPFLVLGNKVGGRGACLHQQLGGLGGRGPCGGLNRAARGSEGATPAGPPPTPLQRSTCPTP
jgi:GTP-binding protein SAR1